MFRTCARTARTGIASRATASTSSLHTSATSLAVSKLGKRSTPATKKRFEQEKRVEVATERAANAPHVVLGTRPGEEWKWNECDLAKCIVNEEQIRAATEVIPGHGVFPGSADERLLFTTLPALTAETKETWQDSFVHHNSLDKKEQAFMRNLGAEGIKAEQLAKLLDLRNANAKGIAFENRRRCVHEFSTPVKPNDPGRIEVQAAILTMRIRGLWTHLTKTKKDVANRMNLRILIHQRAKLLKYLKRTSRGRYDMLLPRLALEPEAVEGELIV